MALQSKSIHIVLRAAPSFWSALEKAIDKSGDDSIYLVQGQAKTYSGNGATNPSLFAQQDWDDHPGPAPSDKLRQNVEKALTDPDYSVHVYNSFVGDNANDRARAGEFILAHLNHVYKRNGGFSTLAYHMLYDVDGRNDKVHVVEFNAASGKNKKRSENNAPGGVYAPIIYRAVGTDYITVFDTHSYLHRKNLIDAFGDDYVRVFSNLHPIALNMIEKHKDAIREGRFRLGAPDGWDKKDDHTRNLAILRVERVAAVIWERMPEIQSMYDGFNNFLGTIQFGVTKVREAPYKGAPAKPKVTGVYGNVEGCDCELLDDLADSGSSLTQSGEALLSKGAARVDASICHGPAEEKALHHILNSTCVVNGKTTVIIDNFTTTNTMARVEGFLDRLSPEQKRRTHLINCGDEMVSQLLDFHLQPRQLYAPMPLIQGADLTPRVG